MSHPLSESYQKDRRQYALFSGLLIAWELIGFELPNKVEIAKGGDLAIRARKLRLGCSSSLLSISPVARRSNGISAAKTAEASAPL